jgi:hypothetical protein
LWIWYKSRSFQRHRDFPGARWDRPGAPTSMAEIVTWVLFEYRSFFATFKIMVCSFGIIVTEFERIWCWIIEIII